ncbi:unnamed protein product, partial [Amoebophrya sp. A25]
PEDAHAVAQTRPADEWPPRSRVYFVADGFEDDEGSEEESRSSKGGQSASQRQTTDTSGASRIVTSSGDALLENSDQDPEAELLERRARQMSALSRQRIPRLKSHDPLSFSPRFLQWRHPPDPSNPPRKRVVFKPPARPVRLQRRVSCPREPCSLPGYPRTAKCMR